MDGYIGTHSTLLWNYPDHPTLTLDYGYVDDLHRTLRGKPGERFYIIAPVVAMAFAEDEVTRGDHQGQDLREEAKLLYVGMTRAMEMLLMTCHRETKFVKRLKTARAAALN